MSTQIIAVIINILVMVLPYIGVHASTADLTTAIQTIVAIATGAWVWYQRTTLQQAPSGIGDVNAFGARR